MDIKYKRIIGTLKITLQLKQNKKLVDFINSKTIHSRNTVTELENY